MKLIPSSARPPAALLLLLAASSGCTQESITVDVRSLEQSGRVAFVCLAAPGTKPSAGLPLSACSRGTVSTPFEFGIDTNGNTTRPHIYALVTQVTRGEVAVIDVSADEGSVLDQDPNTPGANFLPVGAQPTDIVATPVGTAAFVAVSEVGREGIFALPSTKMRYALQSPSDPSCNDEPNDRDCLPPTLSSFPACSLPSAPGAMVMVADPAVNGAVRPSCDSAHGAADEPEDLANGDIGLEQEGRQKLVVAMPELGGFAVIDAQKLLGRPEGSYEPCDIERWVPLTTEVPPPPAPPAPPPEVACRNPETVAPAAQTSAPSRPSGLAYVDGHLYIADLGAPVIHVIDMPTPCEPAERPPLVPGSVEDPTRVVVTSRVSVSPRLSADLRRYLYAVDADEGSVMVFDVSDDTQPRYPIRRPNPAWNPFQPADRIRFGAPVRDVLLIDRDFPAVSPATGAAVEGTRCDPDPSLEVCTSASLTCDPATLYRTSSDYTTGAHPNRMRGSFAFLMTTTGQLSIVDVDDLDAACRTPSFHSPIFGCPPVDCATDPSDPDKPPPPGCPTNPWAGSREVSCNVVQPNATRSARYIVGGGASGQREPSLQTYPLLYDEDGTLLSGTNEESESPFPRMVATVPKDGAELHVTIGGATDTISGTEGELIDPSTKAVITEVGGPKNRLVMNFEEPRAHVRDQNWSVTYEGALPGFQGRVAELCMANDPLGNCEADEIRDADSRFCDGGVQSWESIYEKLAVEAETESPKPDEATLRARADALADYAQIVNELTPEDNVYWSSAKFSYQDCKALYGTATAQRLARNFRIREAYQDRVVIEPQPNSENTVEQVRDSVKECFPGLIGFNVRVSGQWIVFGDASGFMHHVIPDPATGVCRDSCDGSLARLNGRVRSTPRTQPPPVDGDKTAFLNPMFRFAIREGTTPPRKDMQFRFTTQSSFVPLFVSLADPEKSINVRPNAVALLPSTGEVATTDGLFEGLFLFDPARFLLRQYY